MPLRVTVRQQCKSYVFELLTICGIVESECQTMYIPGNLVALSSLDCSYSGLLSKWKYANYSNRIVRYYCQKVRTILIIEAAAYVYTACAL